MGENNLPSGLSEAQRMQVIDGWISMLGRGVVFIWYRRTQSLNGKNGKPMDVFVRPSRTQSVNGKN